MHRIKTDSQGNEIHINDKVAYTYSDDARIYVGRVYKIMNKMIEIDIGAGSYNRFRRRDAENVLILK